MPTEKKENIDLDLSTPLNNDASPKLEEENPPSENTKGDEDSPVSEPVKEKLSPLEVAEKKAAETKTKYTYLLAEFENYKKNTAKEQLRLLQFGSEYLILDILKISDLFDMALQAKLTADNYDNIYTGFKMTADELARSLENHGLKKISIDTKKFDPHLHEAISSEVSETVPSGDIIKECKVGYTLHDKVIRPSQVIVSADKLEPKDNEK